MFKDTDAQSPTNSITTLYLQCPRPGGSFPPGVGWGSWDTPLCPEGIESHKASQAWVQVDLRWKVSDQGEPRECD